MKTSLGDKEGRLVRLRSVTESACAAVTPAHTSSIGVIIIAYADWRTMQDKKRACLNCDDIVPFITGLRSNFIAEAVS